MALHHHFDELGSKKASNQALKLLKKEL